MKAAAVAVAVAAAFLAAVLWGVGQPQATRARAPSSIELRQANPTAPSPLRPSPRSTTPAQKVHRTVGDRRLDDFEDRRGRNRGKDNSGPGGGDGGSGDDSSGG